MFKFRLEPVLRYRGHIKRKRRQDLAEGERTLRAADKELQAMLAARGRAWKTLAAYRSSPNLRVPELVACGGFLRATSRRIARQGEVVEEAKKSVEERRGRLAESLKAERVIARLRDRRRIRYLREERKRERRGLDEVARQLHMRTRGKGHVGTQ